MKTQIKNTLENKEIWEKSLYYNFLKTCNKSEFLKSQTPFFFAVQAFPRMLLKFASLINTSEERLLVIENIWEEHGNGDQNSFHTSSFKKHLSSLSENDRIPLNSNPFVTKWIDNILNKNYSVLELGTILAAIEYMYAVISEDIAAYIDSLDLINKNIHYSKHSELDWSHGKELITSLKICGHDVDETLFIQTQLEFIALFNKLCFPTEKELNNIVNLDISFFHNREDSDLGIKAINYFEKDKLDLFSICSGGEHILNYLIQTNKFLNITISDLNPHQIELFERKLSKKSQFNEQAVGKFEYFFAYLREAYKQGNDFSGYKDLLDNRDCFYYIMNVIFSKDNLNKVFSDSATKYSNEDFSKHFGNALLTSLLDLNDKNSGNIFYSFNLINNHDLDLINDDNYKITKNICNLISYDFTSTYDIIDLSNIGDWMSYNDYQIVLQKAYKALNYGGILIVRKLLGDYNLEENLYMFDKVESVKDKTCFYSESYLAYK
jgi:hypothetical protein